MSTSAVCHNRCYNQLRKKPCTSFVLFHHTSFPTRLSMTCSRFCRDSSVSVVGLRPDPLRTPNELSKVAILEVTPLHHCGLEMLPAIQLTMSIEGGLFAPVVESGNTKSYVKGIEYQGSHKLGSEPPNFANQLHQVWKFSQTIDKGRSSACFLLSLCLFIHM